MFLGHLWLQKANGSPGNRHRAILKAGFETTQIIFGAQVLIHTSPYILSYFWFFRSSFFRNPQTSTGVLISP